MADDDLGTVYFEIQFFGTSARVAAIHARTNTEVQVVCPATYSEFSMHQAALRKLRYVLKKRDKPAPDAVRGRGRLV